MRGRTCFLNTTAYEPNSCHFNNIKQLSSPKTNVPNHLNFIFYRNNSFFVSPTFNHRHLLFVPRHYFDKPTTKMNFDTPRIPHLDKDHIEPWHRSIHWETPALGIAHHVNEINYQSYQFHHLSVAVLTSAMLSSLPKSVLSANITRGKEINPAFLIEKKYNHITTKSAADQKALEF